MSLRSVMQHLCVAPVALVPGLALAADFNFIVPVQLSNLPPDINQLYVSCSVEGDSQGIGAISGDRPISGGGFQGEVAIGFDVAPGVDPILARRYTCTLGLAGNIVHLGNQRLTFSPVQETDGSWAFYSNETSPPLIIPSSPGQDSVLRVSGDVPPVTRR